MALFSKMHPDVAGLSCQTLIHPFTSSCTMATIDMNLAAFYGSARFFAIIYLLNFLLKASKDRQSATKSFVTFHTLKAYLRSVAYSSTTGTTFVCANCISRWIIGKYTEFNCCFFSSFVAGLAIILEAPSRRRLAITSYANMALDALLRRLEEKGDLHLSKYQWTLAFMGCNSCLMYLLRFGGEHQKSFWFFTPKETTEHATTEDHLRKVSKLFLQCFMTGLGVSATRLLLSDLTLLKKPLSFVSQIFSSYNLALGAFLASYVTIYESLVFFLSRAEFGLTGSTRTALAGFAAGATFFIQPSRTIFSSAAVNVFQIIIEMLQSNGSIPRLPYDVFLFCCYNGFLYHMRAMNPSAVPRTFIRIMSWATHKRSDYIYGNYAKIAKAL